MLLSLGMGKLFLLEADIVQQLVDLCLLLTLERLVDVTEAELPLTMGGCCA